MKLKEPSSAERIILDYGDTIIEQKPASEPFEPASYGAWGEKNGEPLEIIGERQT